MDSPELRAGTTAYFGTTIWAVSSASVTGLPAGVRRARGTAVEAAMNSVVVVGVVKWAAPQHHGRDSSRRRHHEHRSTPTAGGRLSDTPARPGDLGGDVHGRPPHRRLSAGESGRRGGPPQRRDPYYTVGQAGQAVPARRQRSQRRRPRVPSTARRGSSGATPTAAGGGGQLSSWRVVGRLESCKAAERPDMPMSGRRDGSGMSRRSPSEGYSRMASLEVAHRDGVSRPHFGRGRRSWWSS